jgi:hypothetical protein
MIRLMSVVMAAVLAAGCSGSSTDPESDGNNPPQTTSTGTTADAFVGEWRSTTPNAEFVRLTVSPRSSEQGSLAARLTYSGIYWDGSGRVESGAFVATMFVPGVSGPNHVMTARIENGTTLRVTMGPATGEKHELTFVRGN